MIAPTSSELARRIHRRIQQGSGALIADEDAARFARRLGFIPDDWQHELLTATEQNILLNCSRQSGKSTCTALIALYEALTVADSLILLLSPSLRQSSELIRRVYDFYRDLGRASGYSPSQRETILTLELSNGSRIASLPGTESTIRGFSGVKLLIVDEAARCDDTLYLSVRPMLAISGGRLILLSTPFGRRGFYFEAWANGGQDWRRFEVPATKCPRISPEFLQQERRTMGHWWYSQEFECQFQDSSSTAFRYDDIMAATEEEVEVWHLPAWNPSPRPR